MKMNTELFIEAALKKHGSVFDYSKTNYVNAKTKLIISCPKHGDFQQRASSHLEGYGCKKCALEGIANKKLNSRTKCSCNICGKEFSINESSKRKGAGKFCSIDCYRKSIKTSDIKCVTCGENFLPSRKNSKYCSIACSSKSNKKFNTVSFIANAIDIHGNKYSYDRAIYLGMNHKIQLICKNHGAFEQRAADHLLGRGCQKCAAEINGELNRKFEIVCCRSCGKNFRLPPHKAKTAQYCSAGCAADASVKLNKKTFEDSASIIHHGYYSYEKVNFLGRGSRGDTNVTIICPVHGEFEQMAKVHLHGAGCAYCSGRKIDKNLFLKKSSALHGAKYDYSLVTSIKDGSDRVLIRCPRHGVFEQSVGRHLAGDGCRACAIELRGRKNYESAKSRFTPKANLVHDSKYDYSKAVYLSAKEPIEIVCIEHGSFWQDPNNHLNGAGCPSCSNRGFNKDLPAILYYLRINDGYKILWKIGITNNTVKDRFPRDFKKITILETWGYELGKDAYIREQEIIRQYRHLGYTGDPVLMDSGNTELFVEDILGLDMS
jgi:hypothetical protein